MDYDQETDEYVCPKCGMIIENPDYVVEPIKLEVKKIDTDYMKIIKNPDDFNNISSQLNKVKIYKSLLDDFINENRLFAFKDNFYYFFKIYYKAFLKNGRNPEVSITYFIVFFNFLGIIPIDLKNKIISYMEELNVGKHTKDKIKTILSIYD